MNIWDVAKCSLSQLCISILYTGYAGCAITAGIPVKFGTAHGRCRPDVGSTKRIDVYGSEGVSRPSLDIGNS